jgi:hypothetical protein
MAALSDSCAEPEKDTRASMVFGRVFEHALGAYFRREDSAAVLYKEWTQYRDVPMEYSKNDGWDRMAQQGVQLLELFAQYDRIKIRQPKDHLQLKLVRALPNGNDFLAYVDGIGFLDGSRCLIEWKTTGSRYPEEPAGLLALDPQLICYSWITGITDVAMVVFVRKRTPEIQYLRTSITDAQRQEFGWLVENTIRRIEAGHFPPHSGIRFPQNGCVSCSHLGLCLDNQTMVDANLICRPGASDLDWIDELDY